VKVVLVVNVVLVVACEWKQGEFDLRKKGGTLDWSYDFEQVLKETGVAAEIN